MRILTLLMLAACTPATLLTEAGPQSGYFEVEAETDLEVRAVRIGGVSAVYVHQEGSALRFMVQGHQDPGVHDLVLTDTEGDEHTVKNAFEYLPGETGFERMVTLGASLGQGVQAGVPTVHGQRHAPSRVIAEAAGAYHPIPLLVPDLFPRITGADVTAAPDCQSPDVVSFIASAAADVLSSLEDEEQDQIGFYLGREDPDIEVFNLSVGNSSVGTLLRGPPDGDIAQRFLARLVYDPYGEITDPVPYAQIELVEALDPTVIMVPDTYGNDLIGAILSHDLPSPESLEPPEELAVDMDSLVDRLAATGAQVFLANIPQPTLLPVTAQRVVHAREAGWTEQQITDSLDAIDAIGEGYDAALRTAADRHDNVHVVDIKAAVEEARLNGIPAGDQTLSVKAYGGLLTVDGVHFSDVGYALEANLFMEAMELAMGVSLPRADLGVVIGTDPNSPDALLAEGLDPSCLPAR